MQEEKSPPGAKGDNQEVYPQEIMRVEVEVDKEGFFECPFCHIYISPCNYHFGRPLTHDTKYAECKRTYIPM